MHAAMAAMDIWRVKVRSRARRQLAEKGFLELSSDWGLKPSKWEDERRDS